ncbi:peptidase S8/S53 domain-containing protein [Fusarium tricinctum]|uniref:Peptidase S8/S53 domain-containing protein n=1 Tax=Fusarium tricinctum TaxID=61284 RepID=A0A8K0S0Z2_9HYPO|nr:peptidase S8/S53 domain-containing protein [Fusarium tricinctum]
MRSATLLALLPFALAAPSRRAEPAPVLRPRGVKLVDGKYIVKMKGGIRAASVSATVSTIEADADYTYSKSFSGFAASLKDDEIEKLKNDPNVEYIEQDAYISIKATTQQENAPWGLARLSSSRAGGKTYTYDESAGEGTCAYIIDTGIDVEHPDFDGRATFLKNFAGGSDGDGQGHGTHVAGTIGSTTYGVAKKTSLFAVKVLGDDGSGTNSAVIAGMDFVAGHANKKDCPKGTVVNMSLGGEFSSAVNKAAASIVDAGLFLAVAAGNEAVDASGSSPASEASACTVGATTRNDTLAYYSNFGDVVDVLAPGTDILSTWPGGKTNTISGTSMASPHVAGLAAYFLGLGHKAEGLCDYIVSAAIDGVVANVPSGTVNKLINNGVSK